MQIVRIICINAEISVSCGRSEVSAETDTGSDCHKKRAEYNQGDAIDSEIISKQLIKANQINKILLLHNSTNLSAYLSVCVDCIRQAVGSAEG